MKNKLISTLLYLLSILSIILYLYIIFNYKIHNNPFIKLILLFIIVILTYFGGYFLIKYNKKYKYISSKVNLVIWFVLYVILIITFTLLDSYFLRRGSIIISWNKILFLDYINYVMNLIPFKMILEFIIGFIKGKVSFKIFCYNIFGNLFAFMPFAFFLPKLFKKEDNTKVFLITIFIIVSIIEIIQFVTLSGTFDIDDYILNIGGAYIMFKILKYIGVNKSVNIYINNL